MKQRDCVFGSIGALSVLLSACASSDVPPPSITTARSSYNQASRDPIVAKYAALELEQARDALNQAEQQWHNGKDAAEVDSAAYVADRRAQTAEQTAKLRDVQDRLKIASAQAAMAAESQRQQQAQTAQMVQSAQATMAAQNQRIQELQDQLAQLRSGQAQENMVLTLGSDVMFDTGKSELKPGAQSSIRQVAHFLEQHRDRSVVVRGYTDNVGNADFNLRLSQARANAVKAALIEAGVAPSQVSAFGMGDSAPVATNSDPGGRQLNRRVELAISNSGSNQSSGG